MPTKIVYSAPAKVTGTLNELIQEPAILEAMDGLCCLDGSVLDYIDFDVAKRTQLHGGYLRLAKIEAGLEVVIEIDSPSPLSESELKALQRALDGQVSDGIGEAGFDFVSEKADVSVELLPPFSSAASNMRQSEGDAWLPSKQEKTENRNRCRAVQNLIAQAEKARRKSQGKNSADPEKLLRLLAKAKPLPREEELQKIRAEIGKLGGDLRIIKDEALPFINFNSPELLQLLLEAKLKPNIQDCDGHSLIYLACWQVKCLELMLAHGADINFRNAEVYQATALMRAASKGRLDAVQFLLENGADPKLKDRFGKTALDQARQNKHFGEWKATIELLESVEK